MSANFTEFAVTTADGENRLARCCFATLRDVNEIEAWPQQVRGANDSVAEDALEFAELACERWRFNRSKRRTASGIPAMKRKIATDKFAELAVLCIARATWTKPSILGIALFRRTWCNHLALDFLATHPLRLMNGPDRIGRVGTGLLFGIVEVALALNADVLWAETTQTSAPFYKRVFDLEKVEDLLWVPEPNLRAFHIVMEEQAKKSGLRKE